MRKSQKISYENAIQTGKKLEAMFIVLKAPNLNGQVKHKKLFP